jgi:transcriptional regulator with XRE-family HTH domain
LLSVVYQVGNLLVNTIWEVYDVNMINEESKYEFIGKKIREARESAGLSQKDLAEKLGYETSTAISYMEAGERKVSVVDLEKIAELLGRDLQFFLGQESKALDVRVALRAQGIENDKDHAAIMRIVEMAKNRKQDGRSGK